MPVSCVSLYMGLTHNPMIPEHRDTYLFYKKIAVLNFAVVVFIGCIAMKRNPGQKYVKLPPLPSRSGADLEMLASTRKQAKLLQSSAGGQTASGEGLKKLSSAAD